jgi:hypothetical protein
LDILIKSQAQQLNGYPTTSKILAPTVYNVTEQTKYYEYIEDILINFIGDSALNSATVGLLA